VPSFLVTPVSGRPVLQEEVVQPGRGLRPGKIAIIEVEGLLMNVRSGGFLQPRENPVSLFVQQMERAEQDNDVKAVVLRINSPGGTVSASDVMYQTVQRFRERSGKPVVAAAQEVVASGAYYIALSADEIVVQPTSVVGSIGVIFQTFDLTGTLAKVGARTEAIKSGPMKDMGSFFKPLSEMERQVMQGMIDAYHARFVLALTAARKLESDQLKAVSDGRVFTGDQAFERGLVDRTGMLPDALDIARALANAPNAKAVLYKRPYGYGGSIYASSPTPATEGSVININLTPPDLVLPTGFYYLWRP
jgi:protease IV